MYIIHVACYIAFHSKAVCFYYAWFSCLMVEPTHPRCRKYIAVWNTLWSFNVEIAIYS